MTSQIKYIFAAIDGTNSHSFLKKSFEKGTSFKSYTYEFFKDLNVSGGKKEYWHGPGGYQSSKFLFDSVDFGVFFGLGTDEIIDDVVSWINSQIRNFTEIRSTKPFIKLNKQQQAILRAKTQDIRICLVGHSRGGYACICAAQLLPIPVYFMGLYDAVDMHWTRPGIDSDIVSNVDNLVQAIRDLDVKSRTTFWNAGNFCNGKKIEKKFYTTHGGINNDYNPNPKTLFLDDISHSCDNSTLSAGIEKLSGYDRSKKCSSESLNVDIWMREQARILGLKI